MLPQESPSIGPGKPLPPSLAGEGTVNSDTDGMRQAPPVFSSSRVVEFFTAARVFALPVRSLCWQSMWEFIAAEIPASRQRSHF